MHPVLADNVNFYLSEEGDYIMESPNDGTLYLITDELYAILENLNGKHSLCMPDMDDAETAELQEELHQMGVIRTTRRRKNKWYTYFSLWFFEKEQLIKYRRFAAFLTDFIFYGSIPIAASIFLFAIMKEPLRTNIPEFSWTIYFLSIGTSLALHEIAHMIAAIAATPHAYVREFGLTFLFNIVPAGAYVSMDVDADTPLLRQFKIHTAGVLIDLLYCATTFLVSRYSVFRETLEISSLMMGVMIITNLIPKWDLDGQHMVQTIRKMQKKKGMI